MDKPDGEIGSQMALVNVKEQFSRKTPSLT
jgi:hypothetical protein